MAEDKKSFILYADMLHTIEMLPDDKVGLLFRHLFRYVNDLNPETDDLIVKIAFEPIKQQLKRDLKSWSETKDIKSYNGRLGNLKRYQPDLYELVVLDKLTLEDAEIKSKTRKTSLSDNSESQTSEAVGELAVNGSVTGTVTNEKRMPIKRFTPPSLSEVQLYIAEKKHSVNPDAFFSFYESNGWMVGKNKMKQWRSAVDSWNAKDIKGTKNTVEIDPRITKRTMFT